MKKRFVFLATLLCVFSLNLFAQDTTSVAYTTASGILAQFGSFIYNLFTSAVTAKVLVMFLTVAYFVDPILDKVTWTPANKILAFLWWLFKKIIDILAYKKKADTGTATSSVK